MGRLVDEHGALLPDEPEPASPPAPDAELAEARSHADALRHTEDRFNWEIRAVELLRALTERASRLEAELDRLELDWATCRAGNMDYHRRLSLIRDAVGFDGPDGGKELAEHVAKVAAQLAAARQEIERWKREVPEHLRAVLTEHWLTGIHCNHEAKTDTPLCFCTIWKGPTTPNVGEAVLAWIDHVMEQL